MEARRSVTGWVPASRAALWAVSTRPKPGYYGYRTKKAQLEPCRPYV